MKDFFAKNKILLLGVVLIGAAAWAYVTYFGSSAASTTVATEPLSNELLIALTNLNAITLDNSVFSDPVFASLTDMGVVIPPQNVGRRNPFAPVTSTAGGAVSAPAL